MLMNSETGKLVNLFYGLSNFIECFSTCSCKSSSCYLLLKIIFSPINLLECCIISKFEFRSLVIHIKDYLLQLHKPNCKQNNYWIKETRKYCVTLPEFKMSRQCKPGCVFTVPFPVRIKDTHMFPLQSCNVLWDLRKRIVPAFPLVHAADVSPILIAPPWNVPIGPGGPWIP